MVMEHSKISARLAGIGGFNWSTRGEPSPDYDNDGDLDLYVTNYGQWKIPDDVQICGQAHVRTYCIPTSIKPARHILYRNNGDLTFSDVTGVAGSHGPMAVDLESSRQI